MKIGLKATKRGILSFLFPLKDNDYKPKILEGDFLFYYLILLFLLEFLIVPFSFYLSKTDLFCQVNREAIIELTNNKREMSNLPALKENIILDKAAEMKARDMFANGYFNHTSPSGITPWYWFHKAGYNFSAAGENLGIGFIDSEEIFQAWDHSAEHKANLINPYYTDIGVAVVSGYFRGKKNTIVVQLFGRLKPIKTNKLAVISGNNADTEKKKKTKREVKTTTPNNSTSTLKLVQENKNNGITQETPKKDEAKKIYYPAKEKEVKSATLYLERLRENKRKPSLAFLIFKFIVLDYFNLIRKIIFYSLIIILLVLFATIFIRIEEQHYSLILRAVVFIIFAIIFISLNKSFFLDFIPHNLGL